MWNSQVAVCLAVGEQRAGRWGSTAGERGGVWYASGRRGRGASLLLGPPELAEDRPCAAIRLILSFVNACQ
jgi:hypothetical protein